MTRFDIAATVAVVAYIASVVLVILDVPVWIVIATIVISVVAMGFGIHFDKRSIL